MSNSELVRLPKKSDRIAVIGRTGSGKTFAGLWHLSNANFDVMPWIIVDYKNDESINSIRKAKPIHYSDPLPEQPGIYILKIMPGEDEEISEFFTRIWERENIGVFIDEVYMIRPDDSGFNSLLTQGRSKNIPMIILAQRPVWFSRFVTSEANYFQIFDLVNRRDVKSVSEFAPIERCPVCRERGKLVLEDHHSHYYDVGKKRVFHFAPVPKMKEILAKIDRKLPDEKKSIRTI